MNPENHEARWLAITSRRLFEYADKAYGELRKLEGKTPAEQTVINNARLYIASTRSAAEAMYDLYGAEYQFQPGDEQLIPPEPEQPSMGSRIWHGLIGK